MASFSIPLTGLNADSTALNTIANNLANMNTTGYKSQTTSFSDLLYHQIGSSGSGDAIQVGSGVTVASNTTDFTTGSISSTSVSTDAAIDGSGFFVLDNGGSQLLTRNGAFQLGTDGTLETSGGLAVMGYTATNGVINTNGTLSDITIPTDKVMSPSATTTFSMVQNLNSSSSVGTSTTGTVKVYDSLGNSYEATATYTKTGTNEWSYSLSLPDTLSANSTTSGSTSAITYDFGSSGSTLATVNTGTSLTITGDTSSGGTATITAPTITSGESVSDYAAALTSALSTAGISGVTVTASSTGKLAITGTNFSTSGSVIQDPIVSTNATGTLTFDSSGNLTSPATDVSGITFAGLSDGAATLSLNWDMYDTSGTADISQTSSDSTTSSYTQNGYTTGTYSSFSIESDGAVEVTYSNGQTQDVGQLAIATVSNEQGLKAIGSTTYQTTSASGNAAVGVAGTGGRGTIEGSSLEASNVNISSEFSSLIVAQRAFEANAKSVTTFDTVTQDTINMVSGR
jgi:flagellar hook protein FlgE